MKKSKLQYASMNRKEKTLGIIWLVIQLFLGYLMGLANGLLPDPLKGSTLTFVTYLVNFLVIVCIFSRFLRDSLAAAWRGLWEFAQAVILGFVFYFACDWLLDKAFSYLLPSYTPLLDTSISALSGGNRYLMIIGVVILAPVIEESLYRGLIFRNLLRKKKVLAYILSILAFAAVHVLGHIGAQDVAALVLCFLRYLPAGLCLAWTYAKADNVLAPIVVHAIVNAISIGLVNT